MTTLQPPRLPAVLLATAFLVTSGSAATVAVDDEDVSICDAMPTEELSTAAGLGFKEAVPEGKRRCFYPLGDGSEFTVGVLLYGLDKLSQVETGDEDELVVADKDAIYRYDEVGDWHTLYIDPGEFLDLLEIRLEGYPADAAVAPIDLTVAVGEIVMRGLEAPEAEVLRGRLGLRDLVPEVTAPPAPETPAPMDEGDEADTSGLEHPDVDPDFMQVQIDQGGEAFRADRSEGELALWSSVLESLGADFEQMGILIADSGGMSPDRAYIALRVDGADGSDIADALIATFGATFEATGGTENIGGKDVVVLTSDQQPEPVFVYGSDDAAHLIQMTTREEAATLLEQLP
jgi:hypothetical protein